MFSIVITTYNRSKLLKRCLDSIKNQTFNRYEVLILDDCSSDDTSEMVKEYTNDSKFMYFKAESNYGSSNLIFNEYIVKQKLNKYEYILYMSDDDFLDKNSLLESYNLINKYGHIDVILCKISFNYGDIIVQSSDDGSTSEYFEFSDQNSHKALSKYRFMYHNNLNYKTDMYDYNQTATYEVPYYKMYQNKKIGYSKNIIYIFDISSENREKYLDIKNYIMALGELCYREINFINNKKEAENIFKSNLLLRINCEGNFLSSFDAFPANVVVEYLSRFIDQDNFYDVLDKFATFMKDSFQPSFDETYHKLNSKLYTYKERNDIIKNSKTFMIYCQNEWGKQIKEQFIKQGLECLGFIDDTNSMSCTEFLKSSLEPDFVFIATGKPKLMSDLINNLQPYKGKVLTLHEKDDSL
ncbi:glycosyltransferase family 2 protein [Campylobacter fetus]|uniref:glycosyltransferase family 2 protein n=1 Tax=Campylobacter fetus TaxID=196 RepID=UPI000FCBE7AC|nr:glycosyltransferase family 2 protein [Campylobacter fetus]RUT50347.1 hypothetical protein BWK67_03950 [Campylobacter fetus]RUT50665.1 hypothetical protein BWK51_03935 [Campylobacter fetus]